MPQEIEGSEFGGTKQPGKLPEVLHSLQLLLERIRQEQLAKNRFRLEGLGTEQQQCLECLTLAIMRRIFGEVASEWESSAAAGQSSQITEMLSRLWRSVEFTGTASQASGSVAPSDGNLWPLQRVSQKCFARTHEQGAKLQMNVILSNNLQVADVERTVTQKCAKVQANHDWVKSAQNRSLHAIKTCKMTKDGRISSWLGQQAKRGIDPGPNSVPESSTWNIAAGADNE